MMTLQTDMPGLQAQHPLAAAQIRAAEAVTQIGLHRIDREKRATHGFAAKQDSLASDCNGNVPRTGAPVDGAAVRNNRELRVFIIFKCCGYCLECYPVLLMMAGLMLHLRQELVLHQAQIVVVAVVGIWIEYRVIPLCGTLKEEKHLIQFQLIGQHQKQEIGHNIV